MDTSEETKKLSEKITDTATGLFRQPVQVVDSFVEGHRGRYLNPFLYVALTALVLAFITSFVVSYPETEVTGADPGQIGGMTEETESFRMEQFQDVMEVVALMMNTQFLGFLNFLLIPVLALTSMLFFRESNYRFYGHLILNTYAVGQANLALLILVPVWALFQAQITEPAIHLYPAIFLIGLILLMTYNRYFNINKMADWIRAFSALIIGYFFYSLIAGIVVAFIAFITYVALAVGA